MALKNHPMYYPLIMRWKMEPYKEEMWQPPNPRDQIYHQQYWDNQTLFASWYDLITNIQHHTEMFLPKMSEDTIRHKIWSIPEDHWPELFK